MMFYLLAFAAGFFALLAVLTKHILRSAIYLMAVLCLSAGLYVLAGAEFLAGVQILVYVGGIVVLLVFAVMLTRSDDLAEDRPSLMRKALGLVGAGTFFAGSLALLKSSPLADRSLVASTVNDTTSAIGRKFLDLGPHGYVLPFEIISILLLAVLIGGIVIAQKRKE